MAGTSPAMTNYRALGIPVTRMTPRNQIIDYIAVSREAHELTQRHGREAFARAEKLAADALSQRHVGEYEFWLAVAAALKPREPSG
ncbi:MAG TPA: hypothetical protein VKQ73_14530 [Stellaceae bacterium]|nr:hypothetical protein [Stellaceae bacterium]